MRWYIWCGRKGWLDIDGLEWKLWNRTCRAALSMEQLVTQYPAALLHVQEMDKQCSTNCTHTHIPTHTHTHTLTHTHTHTHSHSYTLTLIHTHSYTHTLIHTHTHSNNSTLLEVGQRSGQRSLGGQQTSVCPAQKDGGAEIHVPHPQTIPTHT